MQPTYITLQKDTQCLDIGFSNGKQFQLPWDYLWVFSPAADAKMQGRKERLKRLREGKAVAIQGVLRVGHYAIRPIFNGERNAGLYSWEKLYQLGQDYVPKWQDLI
jgi:DUF971 family protein